LFDTVKSKVPKIHYGNKNTTPPNHRKRTQKTNKEDKENQFFGIQKPKTKKTLDKKSIK